MTSDIEKVDTIDDSLVVQGTDSGHAGEVDGAGWTITINASYGTMVMAVSGRDIAFVGLGSCIIDTD